MRVRSGWTTRFAVALVAATGTAGGVALLTWLVTSDRPPDPLPTGSAVALEHWTVVGQGVTVHPVLEGPEFDEPVVPTPGASIVVAAVDVTFTDEAALFESGCSVVFRTRDGESEWRADNSAVYDAYGSEDHGCVMDPESTDDDGEVVPAEISLGETAELTFSVEVPAHLADQVVAEFRIDSFLDRGAALRWYQGEEAAFVFEQD
ncbi:hypothetical protein [Auraticoccus monumenti]|uniref:Uncharacterized protein n=1 Tax=Auraticoccus monumenti TaxID=675864 RepID=A0A1G6ZUG1_9ACTN|nr:hypothetical protein [Auraticoccus monumenti]SDE06182.1 hypothetical protein SAMN04489747_2404 [Auraticoccus monumenti]